MPPPSRFSLRFFAALGMFVAIGPHAAVDQRAPTRSELASISAIPLPVPASDPEMRATVTGAWRLESPHWRFGGLSGLLVAVDEEGARRFEVISDKGVLASFTLDRGGAASALAVAPIGGRGSWTNDMEAIALDRDGRTLVALEGPVALAELGRDRSLRRRRVIVAAASWPRNRGAEALAVWPNGRVALIGERAVGGVATALVTSDDPLDADGKFRTVRVLVGEAGLVTDAVTAADGGLLLLLRDVDALRGFRATLARVPAPMISSATWRPEPVLDLSEGGLAENYEGIALDPVRTDVAWILSDDNFNDWQRTLLLRVTLDPQDRRSENAKGDPSRGRPSRP